MDDPRERDGVAGGGTPAAGGSPPAFSRVEPWLAATLVLASVLLTLDHVRGDAATADEPVHLASGVEIVQQGTGRWNPEHPPLAKALAGLALAPLHVRPAADPLRSAPSPERLLRFLFRNEAPGESMLFFGRLPFTVLLVGLLLAVRAVARRLLGPAGGLLALAFAALDPNLVAHAGVVHTDLAVTLFVVLALLPLLRLAGSAGTRPTIHLGLLWGLALLSKFSAPLLAVATLPLLALAPRADGVRWPRVALRIVGAAAVALGVTLAGFAVANRAQSDEDRRALAVDRLEVRGRSHGWARTAIAIGDVLPPAGQLVTGAGAVVLQSRVGAGVNYFLGRVSREGSALYFPLALAVKAPLGLALAAALGALGRRRLALAAALALALLLVASARSTYNIGVRHLLLAFPLAALVAGAAAAAPGRSIRGVAARLALALAALELLAVHPHELSFVNALGGGLPGGRRLFVDSNVDWGQDLVRLARAAPAWAPAGLPAVVFGGDLPARHAPALRPVRPGEEDVAGTLVAVGEAPFALGPELLRTKGAVADADRLERLRDALRARGRRVGAIGGSIGIWRIERPP